MKNKIIKNKITFTAIALALTCLLTQLALPVKHASAYTADSYSGLVKCSGVTIQQLTNNAQTSTEVPCSFQTLISTIQSIINWMFALSIPVAVALFTYAGLLHMSGTEDNKKKSKTVFKNVAIGFIIMLVAFVVVQTLVGWIVDPNFGASTFLGS